MKVLILNHYAVTPDMPGITRHFDLGRKLVQLGHDVTVVASGFDHNRRSLVKLSATERSRIEYSQGVRFVWVRTTNYKANDSRRIASMFAYGIQAVRVAMVLPRPDIVIGSSMHPIAAVAGWLVSRLRKCRFVFEVRDLWPQSAIDSGAISPKSFLARALYCWESFMYRAADMTIVLLPDAFGYLKVRGVDTLKVRWIPNGVDLERFDQPEPENPALSVYQTMDQAEGLRVVYTGTHGVLNGLDVVVDAARILSTVKPSITFFLVGNGSEKERLISKASGLKNIVFCDPVPKSQLPHVLRRADILIHCLRPLSVFQNGISPNKLFDYFASGRPVIMSAGPSNDMVSQAAAGFSVSPGAPEALANAIVALDEIPEIQRERMGRNAREYVEEHHSIDTLAKKLERVLLECLRQRTT